MSPRHVHCVERREDPRWPYEPFVVCLSCGIRLAPSWVVPGAAFLLFRSLRRWATFGPSLFTRESRS